MHLTFSNPRMLILLLALPLFVLLARRLLTSTPGGRLAVAARLLIVALSVLALAQPVLSTPKRSLSVVFALDSSASLDQQDRARALAWIQEAIETLDPNDRAGVVDFAEQPIIARPLSDSRELAQLVGSDRAAATATDVGAALRLASSLFQPTDGKRIVLLSDGLENLGSAQREAVQLGTQGVQVDVVPIGRIPDPEVVLETLTTPQYLREGEPVDLSVSIQSSRETDATLQLWVDGDAVLNQSIRLRAGPNRFALTLDPFPKGFHAFRARVDNAPDTFATNNESYSYSVVKDPARVMLISASPIEAEPLRSLLAAGGFRVDVQPPQAIPSSFGPLKPYDGMVLVDVPARQLSLDQMRTIQGFVESLGRGLLVVGGENSYGAGGYAGTVLGDLLPVEVKAPSRIDLAQVAMVLVFDKSGSMTERTEDGNTKISATRDAAILATDALSAQDYLGILTFDTDKNWLVRPRQVGDAAAREPIRRSIRGLEGSGGTEIYPALEEAFNVIRQVPAQYRYIILLSDGVSFTPGDYEALTARMKADGIVLSTIAVGEDADKDLLSKIAQLGDGRYYHTNRASDIPKITVRETQLAAGAPQVEGTISPELKSPSPILRSLPTDLPSLSGQASAAVREDATTALVSQRGDPLLAQWQRGLGRVVAWTSDSGAKWASSWTTRGDLATFWSRAVRWTLPAPLTSGLYVRSWTDESAIRLRVEAADDTGALLNLLDLRARIGTGGEEVRLAQVAPGRYEARLALPEPGVYPVRVAEYRRDQPTDRAEEGGITVSYPEEFRRFGPDARFLATLASSAGGQMLTEPSSALRREGITFAGEERRPIWPWLVAIALLLFPLDVGLRRLRLDHTFARPYLQALGRAWATLSFVVGRRA